MRRNEMMYLEFDKIVKEVEKAYLIRVGKEQVWVPKSQSILGAVHMCDNPNNWIALTSWIIDKKVLGDKFRFYTGWELVGEYPDSDISYDLGAMEPF